MKSLISNAVVASVLTAGLCASLFVATPAQASPAHTASSAVAPLSEATESADLILGLGYIESIPDSVLAGGDESLRSWIAEQETEAGASPRADVFGCAGAIALMIATTAIPAAKILKIKKLIDTLGGVAKAVRLFWGASFKWEKIRALGGAAAALGAELLGISAVQQKCFS